MGLLVRMSATCEIATLGMQTNVAAGRGCPVTLDDRREGPAHHRQPALEREAALPERVARDGDALARTLAHLIDVHPQLGKPEHDHLAATRAATLHDPLAVACTVDRTHVTVERKPVTAALHDGHVRTFVDALEGKPADVVTSVDGEAFVEFWLAVVCAGRRRPGRGQGPPARRR